MVRSGERQCAGARMNSAAIVLVVVFCAAGGMFAGSALAQEDGEQKGRGWARQHEIDPRTGRRLLKAQEFIVDEQWDEAEAALDKLRIRSLNAPEKTKLYTLRGYVAMGREDFSLAREQFELTIAQDFLPLEERADFRFMIARICMQQDNWLDAIENMKKWFLIEREPNASSYYLLALAYWQAKNVDAALAPALKAVALVEAPQENWLKLLLAVRLTRK